MKLRVGYDIAYACPAPLPMMLMLNIHPSRSADILSGDRIVTDPPVPITTYYDPFGNLCARLVAPAGTLRIASQAIVHDSGNPDPANPWARQLPIADLPDTALMFLLGSRYCETDLLSETAWALFGNAPTGWHRVQAICDFVHNHIRFDYAAARPTRTAFQAFTEQVGVCRDFAHLAVTFCRCMNIPARYCTGYVSDIGMPPNDAPMDFAAWFEAHLDGAWHVFDPRNNQPRWGRVLMARGRDAVDVAISNSFGLNTLAGFTVWTEPAPLQA